MDMLNGGLAGKLILFSIPLAFSSILQQLFNSADVAVVGRFRVSLLKHEAQHTVDRKRFPQITPAELEYRAKLVELHFSGDPGLLQKFLSEADESKPDDSHAVASARIGREFADTDQTVLSCIQTRALELLRAHTRELEEKYGESRDHPNGEAV